MTTGTAEGRVSQSAPADAELASLAILSMNWGGADHSYIDNFSRFVVECLAKRSGWSTISNVKHDVFDRFGINLPMGTVKDLLIRAVRAGNAETSKAVKYREREYRLPDSAPRNLDTVARQSLETQREIQALTDKLIVFANQVHGVSLTVEEAEGLLLDYVGDWALPLLNSSLTGERLDFRTNPAGELVIIKAFVVDLWERDPAGAEYLVTLVKGSMLRSALYLPNPGLIAMRFRATSVYLDTPLLLAALGLKSLQQQEAALELLELARNVGAQLSCLAETAVETRNVIEWNAEALRPYAGAGSRKDRHATIEAMASGRSWSEMVTLASNLEAGLKSLGVSVIESPPWDVQDNDLEHNLTDELDRRGIYARQNALVHDVQALIAVHRLRNRKTKLRIEKCTAIFITTNRPLIAVSRSVADHRGTTSAPIAMLDHEFATLLWLKKPTVAPNLPLKQVIADCYAALNPSDALWNRYLTEIDLLSNRGKLSADEYLLLRSDIEMKRCLVVATRGVVERVTEETVSELVIDLRDRIEKPVREASAAEIEKAKDNFERERERIQTEAREQAIVGERRIQAKRVADGVGRVVATGLSLLFTIGIVAGLLVLVGVVTAPRPVGAGLLFGGVVIPTANQLISGMPLTAVTAIGRDRVAKAVLPVISSWFGNRSGGAS